MFYIVISFLFVTVPMGVLRAECVEGENCVALRNPLGDVNTVPILIGNIISAVLGIVGSIALFMFLDGVFQWLTSAGNSDKIQQGAKTMMFAVLGLFLIFAAYGILQGILGALELTQ